MAGPPVFLAHPSSLAHDTGPHPEQPARITAIERELEAREWLGWNRLDSPPVAEAALEAVHPAEHVEALARMCERGGGHIDLDTVTSRGSYGAALHAAGGAVRLAELLISGQTPVAFSAHRPPGHHATRTRAMGFCLFNNVAVAARWALDRLGLDRVMVLDWDVHHGNGTNDIFHATDAVLFTSIHQYPLYPGSGPASDVGSGSGEGFTVNLPVPDGSGDHEWVALVEHVVVPLLHAYEPELVLISAGYDAHAEDPLAGCRLTEGGFAAMAWLMAGACQSVGAPLGCVLEGGYALGALARSVAATMAALGPPAGGLPGPAGNAAPVGDPAGAPVTRLAEDARERLARWWRL